MFGLAVACRWNLVLYLVLVLADGWVLSGWGSGSRRRSETIKHLAVWALVAAVGWAVVVAASGYGLSDVLRVVRRVQRMTEEDVPYLAALGAFQAAFTPAFVLLTVWGWRRLPKTQRGFVGAALAAVVAASLLLKWKVPKNVLVFLPPLMLGFAAGVQAAWQTRRRWMYGAVAALVALPWLVGVQATLPGRSWGPGFGMRDFDRVKDDFSFRLVVGAGAGFPTPEGPRPLSGHFFVLGGGAWRDLVLGLEADRQELARHALGERLPYVVLERTSGNQVCGLGRLGLRTQDPFGLSSHRYGVWRRRRFAGEGQRLSLIDWTPQSEDLLGDPAVARWLIELSGSKRIALYAYSHSLRRLYLAAPDALAKIGPECAILDLEILARGR